MGFVRVTGYGQSELDAAYVRGLADGYPSGAADVTANPTMILAANWEDPTVQTPINADTEDKVDVHVVNNTTHDLMIILNGSMSGIDISATISVNGTVVTDILNYGLVARTITFPSGGDLHFYQKNDGGTTNREGSIFLTIIGKRGNDTFSTDITWTGSEDKTEGTATFTTLLS